MPVEEEIVINVKSRNPEVKTWCQFVKSIVNNQSNLSFFFLGLSNIVISVTFILTNLLRKFDLSLAVSLGSFRHSQLN